MSTCRVAVIAGDGIGREVIPAGMAAIAAAVRDTDFKLTFTEFPWGCEFYQAHGRMLDPGGDVDACAVVRDRQLRAGRDEAALDAVVHRDGSRAGGPDHQLRLGVAPAWIATRPTGW